MADASDEEEDYMSMTFATLPSSSSTGRTTAGTSGTPETSLQRRQRLKREAEIRARPKSKAELAADQRAAREQALSTSLIDDDPAAAARSKGLSMMKKMGFAAGGTLGADGNENARREPVALSLKEDRGGVGLDSQRKRALADKAEREGWAKKAKVVDAGEFRDRLRREREVARLEQLVYAAQKVAEGMDEARAGGAKADLEDGNGDGSHHGKGEIDKKTRTISARPLKSINVLWRGLVRVREEAERERRMRYDLEQSLSRLPTYEDEDEDEDDRKALGMTKTAYVQVEDLEEDDPELEEFNILEPDEKLRRLVEYLRTEYRYCFWCKFTYPDEEMEGCPGLTEDDHD